MQALKPFLLLLVLCSFAYLAKANNGENGEKKSSAGCVYGYVVDASTRKPVNGVHVSVTSNSRSGEKGIESDASGHFHFAKLPPGDLTIKFEKKGYKLFRRELLPVKKGQVTKISVDFERLEEDGGSEIWHPLLKLLD